MSFYTITRALIPAYYHPVSGNLIEEGIPDLSSKEWECYQKDANMNTVVSFFPWVDSYAMRKNLKLFSFRRFFHKLNLSIPVHYYAGQIYDTNTATKAALKFLYTQPTYKFGFDRVIWRRSNVSYNIQEDLWCISLKVDLDTIKDDRAKNDAEFLTVFVYFKGSNGKFLGNFFYS